MNEKEMWESTRDRLRSGGILEPTEDKVLVRSEGAYYAQEQPSGLIVATDDSVMDRGAPEVGEVVAVGPGRWYVDKDSPYEDKRDLAPMDVAVGDRVLFSRYAGDDIDDGIHGRLVVMRQEEILARVVDGG